MLMQLNGFSFGVLLGTGFVMLINKSATTPIYGIPTALWFVGAAWTFVLSYDHFPFGKKRLLMQLNGLSCGMLVGTGLVMLTKHSAVTPISGIPAAFWFVAAAWVFVLTYDHFPFRKKW